MRGDHDYVLPTNLAAAGANPACASTCVKCQDMGLRPAETGGSGLHECPGLLLRAWFVRSRP